MQSPGNHSFLVSGCLVEVVLLFLIQFHMVKKMMYELNFSPKIKAQLVTNSYVLIWKNSLFAMLFCYL